MVDGKIEGKRGRGKSRQTYIKQIILYVEKGSYRPYTILFLLYFLII